MRNSNIWEVYAGFVVEQIQMKNDEHATVEKKKKPGEKENGKR